MVLSDPSCKLKLLFRLCLFQLVLSNTCVTSTTLITALSTCIHVLLQLRLLFQRSVKSARNPTLFHFDEGYTVMYSKDLCKNQTFLWYIFCKISIAKMNIIFITGKYISQDLFFHLKTVIYFETWSPSYISHLVYH